MYTHASAYTYMVPMFREKEKKEKGKERSKLGYS
jgi:hypothetical protein